MMNLRLPALAIVICGLAACAATAPTRPEASSPVAAAAATTGEAADAVVTRRAKARWDALINKDYGTAYEMLTPGTRATTPRADYVRGLLGVNIVWTGANVEAVECGEPEVCEAHVKVTYTLRSGQPGVGKLTGFDVVNERWLLSDGQWYFLPGQSVN